jgi:(p)ppGpp synthase/HD superfamily hydrolase
MDGTIIAAGLLRFVAEAGLVNISDVSQDLGADISRVLYDCMRFQRTLDQMDLFDEESARAVRQFCLSYHDIRSIIIEFSARLHLMRHAHELARYRQQILALEALQVHAPLAHATGNKEVSTELEDLSFNVIFPESYQSLDNWLSSHWPDGNTILEDCKVKLSIALENDVKLKNLIEDFTISARVKSRFSTMKKLLKDGRKPEEIYDIMGLRVVVNPQTGLDEHETMKNGEAACYRVLGIVKSIWKEVPGRRKDYISKPKPNGYKSLHVAVHLATSNLKQPTMELQIRTSTMDFIANDGDASHSLYKGGLTDPEQV